MNIPPNGYYSIIDIANFATNMQNKDVNAIDQQLQALDNTLNDLSSTTPITNIDYAQIIIKC